MQYRGGGSSWVGAKPEKLTFFLPPPKRRKCGRSGTRGNYRRRKLVLAMKLKAGDKDHERLHRGVNVEERRHLEYVRRAERQKQERNK